MGALRANHSSSSISMIKALVLLSVAALAMGAPEPEAKADPYYGYYGLGHYGYGGLYGGYYGGYGHYYGKRSAEPAPAAKADPYYGYYGKRSADAAPAAKADPYYGVYGLGAHYGYAGYPYVAGAVVYGKRSADPAPAAKPSADPYYS